MLVSSAAWPSSAFCIDKSGLFLTNAHTVEVCIDDPTNLNLIIDSGLPTERLVRAKVVRHHLRLDLALCRSIAPQTWS